MFMSPKMSDLAYTDIFCVGFLTKEVFSHSSPEAGDVYAEKSDVETNWILYVIKFLCANIGKTT